MTLDTIRREAELTAASIDLNWDALSNPTEAEYFQRALTNGVALIPMLENLYAKLISGQSLTVADMPTKLSDMDVAEYTERVEDELYAAYTLRELLEKFHKINDIIALSSGSTLPPGLTPPFDGEVA